MANGGMQCPVCGVSMNHHANKIDYGAEPGDASAESEPGGVLIEAHTCPDCGRSTARTAGAGDLVGEQGE